MCHNHTGKEDGKTYRGCAGSTAPTGCACRSVRHKHVDVGGPARSAGAISRRIEAIAAGHRAVYAGRCDLGGAAPWSNLHHKEMLSSDVPLCRWHSHALPPPGRIHPCRERKGSSAGPLHLGGRRQSSGRGQCHGHCQLPSKTTKTTRQDHTGTQKRETPTRQMASLSPL